MSLSNASRPFHYLSFELGEGDDGVTTIEAVASTPAAGHAAALAEAQQVLDWAWQQFSHTHGAPEDGADWDHDLQAHVEPDGWHTVALTLTGSPAFVDAFIARFGAALL